LFTKKNIRAIGIDDGFFNPNKSTSTIIVGVIMRSNNLVEGILTKKIKVDSLDSTKKIIELIKKSRFKDQIKCVFLSGLNFAGFNIVDIQLLYKKLNIPIIVILRKKPRFNKIEKALNSFKDKKKRLSLIKKAGNIYSNKLIFFQFIGCTERQALNLIKNFTFISKLPEPVRLAHLIASGITLGQSTKPK